MILIIPTFKRDFFQILFREELLLGFVQEIMNILIGHQTVHDDVPEQQKKENVPSTESPEEEGARPSR